MDFYKVPIGFGMELAKNERAMVHYAQLDGLQKKTLLTQAHSVHSQEEMRRLVERLGNGVVE